MFRRHRTSTAPPSINREPIGEATSPMITIDDGNFLDQIP